MMQWLADKYSWSIAIQKADPKADINYYGSYLSHAYSNPVDTLKVAWFTHFEDHSKWKIEIWNQAAEDCDLRCVTSSLYIKPLEKFGPVAKITPGIDRSFFAPSGPRPNENRVGMAGVGRKRKGLHLLEKLVKNATELEVEVSTTGRHFPWPTTWIPWREMPGFYRNLDVYLVTSTIEGIPVPPLEALACGVKVVVPTEVGIMDELPEMGGIRHYKKGDYQDMIRALKLALADKVSQEELRAITEKYTIDAWCESNRRAIESLSNRPQ